eukprot:COSAG04_NODE_1675_length_5968_cov_2.264270_3_plen_468_part_00
MEGAPGPEPEPRPQRVCWVCLEHEPDENGELPQPTGCACRGGSTDHAHVGCVVKVAQDKEQTWVECPTCEQQWTGPMKLALARTRHVLTAHRPENCVDRLNAEHNLADALRIEGEYVEALELGQRTLARMRQAYGPEDPDALGTMQLVAATHLHKGDAEEALRLHTELVSLGRRVYGSEDSWTLNSIEELAGTHLHMGNPHLALPLYQRALDARRRTQGDGHAQTLASISGLSAIYMNLAEFGRALPLSEEALEGKRRLLGPQHPDTLRDVGDLGMLVYNLGNHPVAASLLQEAVQGLTALSVRGIYLVELEKLKGALQNNRVCLADPAAAAECQRIARRQRLKVEASLPTVAAKVVGVQSRPELNGAEVTTKRFLIDKGRYTVQLPPDADGKREKINLKPANLLLADGSDVVATGLTGAPELNGQKGIVEGWIEEKGRYAVRLEDKRRKKAANLKPDNCRADVLAM